MLLANTTPMLRVALVVENAEDDDVFTIDTIDDLVGKEDHRDLAVTRTPLRIAVRAFQDELDVLIQFGEEPLSGSF